LVIQVDSQTKMQVEGLFQMLLT